MNGLRLTERDMKVMQTGVVTGALDYLSENRGIKTFVVGVSGGVDSTLVSALARKVADVADIKLVGASIPIETNTAEEIQRAQDTSVFFDSFQEKDLSSEFTTLVHSFNIEVALKRATGEDLTIEERISLGNIKARLRMAYLYDLAGRSNGLVLSTDNFTEYLLGFWTLHGDVGDLGFIQELWKTEVYALAEFMRDNSVSDDRAAALHNAIEAMPTDGLGVTSSDIDQLLSPDMVADTWRGSYKNIDLVLMDCLERETACRENHPVVARYKKSAFKRDNPHNLKREFLTWVHNGA